MPLGEPHIARPGGPIIYPGDKDYLVWNPHTESWELEARARWFECGYPLDERPNELCTKFIGHGGSHGQRE
jgi:hypothetical protein